MKSGKKHEAWALVVDDDIDSRMVTVMCLQHRGIMAVGAANSVECIKVMLKAVKNDDLPNVIFLDINMPIFSGWEILEMMDMAQPKIKNIPVVLITGEHVPNNSRYRVLRKPYTVEQLMEEVDRVIST